MIGTSSAALDGIARTGFPDASEQQWATDTAAIPATTVARLVEAYRDPQSLFTRATANPPARYNHPGVLAAGWRRAVDNPARALADFCASGAGELLPPENLADAIRLRHSGPDAVMVLDSAATAWGTCGRVALFSFPDNAGPGRSSILAPRLALSWASTINWRSRSCPTLRRDALAGIRRANDLVEATYAAL